MRKIINDPSRFVDDFLAGVLRAHPGELRAVPDFPRAICRVDAEDARPGVAIVTGGGSGHLPLFMGYVGEGLCAAAAVGNTFATPSAETIVAATRAAHRGEGVLYLYGNYSGDRINFDDAADIAEEDGIEVISTRGTDDVASAPAEAAAQRRGVAGITFAYKCAGAAAARGANLAETAEIAQRALGRTRTMGVGLSPTIIPEAGQPTFELEEGEIEIGIGIHGEPGIHGRQPSMRADDLADTLLDAVLAELDFGSDGRCAVLVNSLGATPVEELYIVYGQVAQRLDALGLNPERVLVGRYATSLEMAGCSVSVMALDDELLALLDAPAHAPMLRMF